MRGFVESVVPNRIRGWAFDPERPDSHVLVVAKLDGSEIARAVADQARADLSKAQIGSGNHGFAMDVAPAMELEAMSDVEVFAVADGKETPLVIINRNKIQPLDYASDSETPIVDPAQFPVFILGPARSGTSALALSLLKSKRYEGFGEGHLLALARDLLTTTHKYYERFPEGGARDTLLRQVPARAFERMVRRGFVRLTRTIFPSGRWLDKTPTVEMVRAAPLMQELWPKAKFVFLKRRVIENIASRKRKFPQDGLEEHLGDWIAVNQAWLDVREGLTGAYIEVDQLEMARDPAGAAARIAAFLEMPREYVALFTNSLTNDRPEQTGTDTAATATLADLKLSDAEKIRLMAACDKVMDAFGWGYETYYKG